MLNYLQMKYQRKKHQVKIHFIFLVIFYWKFFFSEDPYFIDEEVLIEREALLTEEDKEVIIFVNVVHF